MANNPLQKSGVIRISDIMKEKEWLGTEAKSISSLVEQSDKNSPNIVLNAFNPLAMRTRISTMAYSISSWYDYNHALTESPVDLTNTLVNGSMHAMVKTSSEIGSGGALAYHFENLNYHLWNARKAPGAALTQSNTKLDVYARYNVESRNSSFGDYTVEIKRGYLNIAVESIPVNRQVTRAEILLTGIASAYSPCKMILVKYERSFWSSDYFEYFTPISDAVTFAAGEQTFILNSAGISILNDAINGSGNFRFGMVAYENDFLASPYLGENLVQGNDATFATVGNWTIPAGFGSATIQNETTPDQILRSVMKVVPTTSERMSVELAASNLGAALSSSTYYYLNWYYRFGGFPSDFIKEGFVASTRGSIDGITLPIGFILPDDPTGKSPEWQMGSFYGGGFQPGNILINVGSALTPSYSVDEFAMTKFEVVNPIFSKTFGGQYDTPKLKYYYAGYPGGISTGSLTGVTSSEATLAATVTTDGRTNILSSGLCWNTTGTPTTSDSKTVDGGTAVAGFSSTATGLSLGGLYYIRPYVTTEAGTYYGVQTTFTTLGLPTVSTQAATLVTSSSVTLNGNATADGGQAITDRGFVIALGGIPTLTDTKISATVPTGTGAFSFQGSGLPPGTTYYVKAFATNASGTQLSAESISFTTLAVLSTMTINAVTNITAVGGDITGAITNFGGAACQDRGFYFKIGSEPTLADFLDIGIGPTSTLGAYGCTATHFQKNTTYFLKAYGTNSVGIALSTAVSFTTLSTLAAGTLQGYADLTSTSVTLNATVTDNGGHPVTDRGFVYKLSASPTIADNKTPATIPTGDGVFAKNITSLSPGSVYGYKAYITTEDGTVLIGASQTFTTVAVVATVTTDAAVTAITLTQSSLNGSVTADGGSTVTERGFCWATTQNPTTASPKLAVGAGVGAFSGTIGGTLSSNTTYYIRGYAINGVGTSYSVQISFTTLNGFAVVASTTTGTSITYTTAASGGNVSSDGGATITQRGICWGTSSGPTTAGSKQTATGTTGTFTANLAGLSAQTTYYVRAYATNANGTSYGPQITITTTSITVPTLSTTSPATSILATTATVAGNVSSANGGSISTKGICFNTTGTPTTTSPKVASGTGTGAISSNLTGLTGSTTYYCRAYATNEAGTAYGNQISFTTAASIVIPTVSTTSPATSILSTSATVAGNVSADGGGTVTGKGICYNTGGTPTTANSTVASGSGVGAISSNLTGLSASTTYYARAYAINSAGTAYGAEVSFTTASAATLPTVTTTSPATSIGSTSATLAGNVSADGGATVTEKGICYNTSGNPTIGNSKVTSGTGTGAISSVLSGLSPATTYHCRAYATNSIGTAYGAEVDFTTTSPSAPSVSSGYASAASPSVHRVPAAKSDINITGNQVLSDGGATITARGVCYSTSNATPTTADSVTTTSGTTGTYDILIFNFTRDGMTLYYRAYAINSVGTSYGVVRSQYVDQAWWDA